MIRYKLEAESGSVIVELDTSKPDEPVAIVYQGENESVLEIQEFIESSIGLYGHKIGSITSARDLTYLLQQEEAQDNYFPEQLEGVDFSTPYVFPDGAVS